MVDQAENERRWDYFLKAMYQAIRYPDPSVWDDEKLMDSREKMCWKASLSFEDMDWVAFRSMFSKEPYWLYIVEQCKKSYETIH